MVGVESANTSDGGGRGRVELMDGQRDDEEGRCESHGLYISRVGLLHNAIENQFAGLSFFQWMCRIWEK